MPSADSRPGNYPIETQLALIRRDIEEIHHALHGDGKGRKGLVDQVEELVLVADADASVYAPRSGWAAVSSP